MSTSTLKSRASRVILERRSIIFKALASRDGVKECDYRRWIGSLCCLWTCLSLLFTVEHKSDDRCQQAFASSGCHERSLHQFGFTRCRTRRLKNITLVIAQISLCLPDNKH